MLFQSIAEFLIANAYSMKEKKKKNDKLMFLFKVQIFKT